MRYARHSINRIDTQRARFDLSTRSVPSVTSVKPLQHVFEYTGAKVLRARVVVTYSAWLYRGYTMGVQGMIFLTYVINEPRARSAVQSIWGGRGEGCAPPFHSVLRAVPSVISFCSRAREHRASDTSCTLRAWGYQLCSQSCINVTNNPLDGTLRGVGRSVFKIRISWHDVRNPHARAI